MSRRRRPLTPQQLAEIEEAAKRGPDGKPLGETMRVMIDGTATALEPASPPEPADSWGSGAAVPGSPSH
jgi:hypothetical protein